MRLTFYLQQGQWPFPENDVSETTERKIDGEGDDADDGLRSDEESDQDDIFVNTNRPEIEQSDSEDSSTDDDEKK